MAPYTLTVEERILLILTGIKDDKWANPLAAQCCKLVIELIDFAVILDFRDESKVQLRTRCGATKLDQKIPESNVNRKNQNLEALSEEPSHSTSSTPFYQKPVANRQVHCFLRSSAGMPSRR